MKRNIKTDRIRIHLADIRSLAVSYQGFLEMYLRNI
nr:hypothetical protein [Bacillus stercoris]